MIAVNDNNEKILDLFPAQENVLNSPKQDNNNFENHGLLESFYTALDGAILGYYPVTTMLSLGSSLSIGTNQFLSTPWSSVGKTMTAKFLRVFTEKVVSGDCRNEETLNPFQQNIFCINEGTYEAVAFRTGVAFVAGAASSFAFKGMPLFALYDGLNVALYDATNELKKVENIQKDETLSTIVDFLDSHSAFLFEGLDVFLKVKSDVARVSADLAKKQGELAVLSNSFKESSRSTTVKTMKDSYNKLQDKFNTFKVATDQTQKLTKELTAIQATKYHGFIGGALVDQFTGAIYSALKANIIDPIADIYDSQIIDLLSTKQDVSSLSGESIASNNDEL